MFITFVILCLIIFCLPVMSHGANEGKQLPWKVWKERRIFQAQHDAYMVQCRKRLIDWEKNHPEWNKK